MIVWMHLAAQEALAPIFGLRNANLHAIINDTSGQLQREAWRRYKTVRKMNRKYENSLRHDKAWSLRFWRRIYRQNQAIMLQAGLSPGLPPVRGRR